MKVTRVEILGVVKDIFDDNQDVAVEWILIYSSSSNSKKFINHNE